MRPGRPAFFFDTKKQRHEKDVLLVKKWQKMHKKKKKMTKNAQNTPVR